jgi:hypothetical protein
MEKERKDENMQGRKDERAKRRKGEGAEGRNQQSEFVIARNEAIQDYENEKNI